jgi:hypothetical protein
VSGASTKADKLVAEVVAAGVAEALGNARDPEAFQRKRAQLVALVQKGLKAK